MTRSLRVPLILPIVGLLSMAALLAAPAAAHGGKGVLVIEAIEPADGLSVVYTVRHTWEDDGHPALDSTVTATLVAEDGTTSVPAQLTPADRDGRYSVALSFPSPGTWTVRFTAVVPPATIETSENLTQTSTTQETAPNTSASTGPADQASGAPTSGDDSVSDTPTVSGSETGSVTKSRTDSKGAGVSPVLVALGVLAACALGGALVVARNRDGG